MKDKHGLEIDVGDIVEFYDRDTAVYGIKPTKGKVTLVLPGAIRAIWEDTNREQSCSSQDCLTLITKAASIPAEPQDSTFTQEDEAMLQHLIARKAKHEAEFEAKKKIEREFENTISDISYCNYDENFNYLSNKEVAERYINTLKAYHGIN